MKSGAIELPTESPTQETDFSEAFAKGWRVLVWNDPVNLMSYVVFVFQKVLGFDQPKAKKHMLEVHEQGRSMVAMRTGWREIACKLK